MREMWAKCAIALVLVLACSQTAEAQKRKASGPKADKPWEAGISATARKQALDLFRTANDEYGRSEYKEAAGHYREALAVWDHPRIHGNLVSALLKLDLTKEALVEVEAALQYGAAPFEPHVYDRLLENRKSIRQLLASVTVSCKLPGAKVTIDGEPLIDCPGTATKVVGIGKHQVVAKKAGYLNVVEDLIALPDGKESIAVEPIPLEKAATVERRWSNWMPWTVVGAGVATIAFGIPFQISAQDNMNTYDSSYADYCGIVKVGCTEEDFGQRPEYASDAGRKSKAQWQNAVALSAFAVGTATLITGGVLVYMNQPRTVRLNEDGTRFSVAPLLGPEITGLTVKVDY